jgi:hypothetical protein
MDKIIVYDNFLNTDELDIALKIIKDKPWNFGHESTGAMVETPFWSMNLMSEDFFSSTIKTVIEKTFSKKLNLIRVYANGQTFGQDGGYHQDHNDEHAYTFCLYLTDMKNEFLDTACGYITFKLPNEKYNLCYEPVFNRGLFFPSNMFHKSHSFCRYVMDLRICVAWKFVEII